MRRAVSFVLLVLAVMFGEHQSACAQDWTRVFRLQGTVGSAAFFCNGQEGFIGTGEYQSSMPAQIYYTSDGGTTWRLTQMVNPYLRGQVTDIYFRTRKLGWATIVESGQNGWSGVYRSTDGGMTWDRVLQSSFPVGIRETSVGVFYTDRNVNPGVNLSTDSGKTWRQVGVSGTALGIDFLDDRTGFVTSQAISGIEPHLITTDGGLHWQSIPTAAEAWSVYGDRVTKSFFLASERDRLTFSTASAVFKVPVSTQAESRIRSYADSGLAGAIAGAHVCNSVIYVQGGLSKTSSPNGLIRTTDGGANWASIGGPSHTFDKRFAVTGRGATVFAFDDGGGVWRTTDGGDGAFSPSALGATTIALSSNTIQAAACDSASITISVGYHLCDSVQVSHVAFVDDSLGELRSDLGGSSRFFSGSSEVLIPISFHPLRPESRTAKITLTIRQPDGYVEDTTITVSLIAGPSKSSGLVFTETTGHDTIDFDSVSTCVGSFERVTIVNLGCTDQIIDSILASGAPFSLTSGFRPFSLSPGGSRTFLVGYAPDTIGRDKGELYVRHPGGVDSLRLLGIGYSSGDAVSLLPLSTPVAAECDSASFSIALKNISCRSFKVDSLSTVGSVHAISVAPDSMHPGDKSDIGFEFVPSHVGGDTAFVKLAITYQDGRHYDTLLKVIGSGTPGTPEFATSRTTVDLGTISYCGTASDTLKLLSFGCADVTLSAAFDSTSGFTLARAPRNDLSRHDSDIITIEYQPHHEAGTFTTELVLTTNAGVVRIPVRVTVTADPGAITIQATPNIQARLCERQDFAVTIVNSLCDSVEIRKLRVIGKDSLDFDILDTSAVRLASSEKYSIRSVFAPQDSLARTAALTLSLRGADGAIHDTSITLSGQGIGVPPIVVALGVTSLHVPVLRKVAIPVYSKSAATSPIGSLDANLIFNSDLLSPTAVNSNGSFGAAATRAITIQRCPSNHAFDTVSIHLALSADATVPAGELFELDCTPYVTSALSTDVILASTSFGATSGAQCLSSTRVDTLLSFTLDRECGDTIFARALGLLPISIESIEPNPTNGEASVTFEVNAGYGNDGVLEIYDVLGRKLDVMPLAFGSEVSGKQTLQLDLKKERGEGIRYLRLISPLGVQTRSVLLVR